MRSHKINYQILIKFFSWAVTCIIISCPAFGASPVSKVSGAKVNEGQKEIQSRFGYSEDEKGGPSDNRLRMRQHLDYGFNDFYAFRAILSQDKRAGNDIEHNSFIFENRFQLIESKNHGWDGGFRLSYNYKDGDKKSDEVAVNFIAQVPFFNMWEFKHNIILGHEIGQESERGISLDVRNQIVRRFQVNYKNIKKVEAGFALFNDLGNLEESLGYNEQDHEIRPIIKISFKEIFIKMGYGFGLSDGSAKRNIKLSIGTKF